MARRKKASVTARSLEHLRDRGYRCEVVEHKIPYSFVTKDLFGWIDVVAVHPEHRGVLGVQVTTASNASSRRKKAVDIPALKDWLKAENQLVIHAWRKRKRRLEGNRWSKTAYWELVEHPVTTEVLEELARLPVEEPRPRRTGEGKGVGQSPTPQQEVAG